MAKFKISILFSCIIIFLSACNLNQNETGKACLYEWAGKVYDIPELTSVEVDGCITDWDNKGTDIMLMSDINGNIYDSPDFAAKCKLGWNEQGLLVCLNVTDNDVYEINDPDKIFSGDVIELFIADKRGGKEMVQYIIAPGVSDNVKEPLIVSWNMRSSRPLVEDEITIHVAAKKTAKGYTLEALIPFKNIGKTAETGKEIGFQVYANDNDKTNDKKKQLAWQHMPNTYKCSWAMQRLQLTEKTSCTVNYAVRSFVMDEKQVHVNILTDSILAGNKVIIRDTTGITDSAVLSANGHIASAQITIPYKKDHYLPFSVWMDDEMLEVIDPNIVAFIYEEKEGYPLNDEIRILKMEDRLSMPKPNQVLFVGHSGIRYWKTVEADMKGFDVLNRGFGGSKIVHLNHYFDKIVLPYKPRKIVVWEGANDMNDPSATAKEIFNECVVFVDKVRDSLPETEQVYFLSHPLIKGWGAKKHDRYKKLNQYLAEYAAEDTLTSFIEIIDPLINEKGAMKEGLLRPDHHHLNPKAYALIAPVVRKALE